MNKYKLKEKNRTTSLTSLLTEQILLKIKYFKRSELFYIGKV